mmetsp:Transcript_16531/g.21632  ORF Transcript_16531/g.21632 Transcript_16531/m.21632 type:complete len:113 (-) Transcript_16531:135-473(-)
MASSGDDNGKSKGEVKAQFKDDARQSRFTFRKRAEELLRQDMKEEALAICKPQVGTFAKCAEEQSLMVVFRCQDKLKEVNSCLADHNGPEAWEKYKAKNAAMLARRGRGDPT